MSRYVLHNNGTTVAYGVDEQAGYYVEATDAYGATVLDKDQAIDGLTGPELYEELRWLGVAREVPMARGLAMVNGRPF